MSQAEASGRLRAAVLIMAGILLLLGLGLVDAWAPDEPRYLQIAEELRALEHGPGGLVLLRLNDEPYTQKPPLYYWLAAALGAPFGRVGEAAARLPSALAGLGTVALTLWLGARLFGGRIGVLGAGLLLTVYEFGHLSRRIQLDPLLALLETAALCLFYRIDRHFGRPGPQVAALHALLGLAVLCKGPVGLILPLLTMAGYLALEGRLRELGRVCPPWAFLLSVLPGAAWIAGATALAPEGFAGEALGSNVIGRFFAGTSHERPFYYYLFQLPIDFLPWTLLWPIVFWAARRHVFSSAHPGGVATERRSPGSEPARRAALDVHGERRHDETRRAWHLLLAWVGASVLFFSLSAGKRGLYLLPAFPAMALLCADATTRWLAGRTTLPRALALALGTFALILAGASVFLGGAGLLGELPGLEADVVATLDRPWLIAFACAGTASVIGGWSAVVVMGRMGHAALRRFAAVIVAAWVFECAVFFLLYPALDPSRSPAPIAQAAQRVTPEGEPLGLVGDRAMLGGLLYYGERSVVELDDAEDVAAFWAGGGRTLVLKRRRLDRVEPVGPYEIVGRARGGRREWVVVQPRATRATRANGVP